MTGSTQGRLGTAVNEIEASRRLGVRKRLLEAGLGDVHKICTKRPLSGHYWPIIGGILKRGKTALFSLPRFWGEKIKGGKKYEN